MRRFFQGGCNWNTYIAISVISGMTTLHDVVTHALTSDLSRIPKSGGKIVSNICTGTRILSHLIKTAIPFLISMATINHTNAIGSCWDLRIIQTLRNLQLSKMIRTRKKISPPGWPHYSFLNKDHIKFNLLLAPSLPKHVNTVVRMFYRPYSIMM